MFTPASTFGCLRKCQLVKPLDERSGWDDPPVAKLEAGEVAAAAVILYGLCRAAQQLCGLLRIENLQTGHCR